MKNRMIIDSKARLILAVSTVHPETYNSIRERERKKKQLFNETKFFQKNFIFLIISKIHIYAIYIVIVMLVQS